MLVGMSHSIEFFGTVGHPYRLSQYTKSVQVVALPCILPLLEWCQATGGSVTQFV